MKFLIKIIFLSTIISFKLLAITYVINQPGVYNLGADIVEIGLDVVLITTNNVTLDLGEHLLAGGNNGIVIDPNLSSITIRNGCIAQIVNEGIVVGASCSNIRIQNVDVSLCGGNAIKINSNLNGGIITDMFINSISQSAISTSSGSSSIRMQNLNISNCGGSTIELLGTATNEIVENILIEHIATASCSLSPTFSHVIRVDYGKNIVLRDVTIANCGNFFNEIKLMEFNNCNQCGVQSGLWTGNLGNSLIGLSLCHTESTIIQGVNFVNNCALSGNLTGFLLTDTSLNNFLAICRVLTSSALNGNAVGYDFQEGSDGILLKNCDAAALIGQNVTGYDMHYSITGMNNILQDCEIGQCIAFTGTYIGFNIDNADCGTLSECISSYNSCTGGRAVGLLFKEGTGGNSWHINSCRFIKNKGINSAESFGILVQEGCDNLFIQNIAFNNGSVINTQMDGVPFGSITQLNPTNLNAALSPWANIVVIS